MGVCNSNMCNKQNKKEIDIGRTSNTTVKNSIKDNNEINYKNIPQEKKVNPHSTISQISNSTIIKHINDIHGDAINIDNCSDSTIIILDSSAQVIINNCKNCNFFIAPCTGSINIRKCEGINIISASGQLRCSDVKDCKASIYAQSQPALERVKNFNLSCFFFMYTELPDLFQKADLNVWNNNWSEYHNFSTEDLPEINYFNAKEDLNFIDIFLNALKDQEICVDQYYPVPLTNGLNLDFKNNHKNLLLFFRENSVDPTKIYELLGQDLLSTFNINLVKSLMLDKNDEFIKNIKVILSIDKKEKLKFFDENVNQQFLKSNTVSHFMKRSSFIEQNNKFVVVWFVNDGESFDEFIHLVENEIENCCIISDYEVEQMNEFVKKVFKNFKL